MPGKRKRAEAGSLDIITNENKPVSAIAAARLIADVATKSATRPGNVDDGLPGSSHVSPESAQPTDAPLLVDGDAPDNSGPSLCPVPTIQFCTWISNSTNVLLENDSELVINLPKHTTIALVGCFAFAVLRGAVNMNGANIGAVGQDGLKTRTYHAFVPRTHPILKIRGLDGTNHIKFMTCETPVPLASVNPYFNDIWYIASNDTKLRSYTIITESSATLRCRTLSPEIIPGDWLRAIEACTIRPSITLVAGLSNSGKSLLALRLVNRSLTGLGQTAQPVPAVFYMDLDPDYQEYMLSGQISLVLVRDLNLGPNFTHPAINQAVGGSGRDELVRAHPIPANLTTYLDHYQTCIEDLFSTYLSIRSQHPLVPLVIKTTGFLYDYHFGLLSRLLGKINPHNIIHFSDRQSPHIDTETKAKSLQAAALRQRGIFHEVTASKRSTTPIRTASELNAMQFQSYFHLDLKNIDPCEQYQSTWTSQPLSNSIPWEFCYGETIDRTQDFVGFATYTDPIEPASLVHMLNGSIVHIILSKSPLVFDAYTTLPRAGKHQIPYFPRSNRSGRVEPLDPRESKFICTAMIRGFDLERKMVQLLVPSTHEALLCNLVPKQTVFVFGCCSVPEWALLEACHAREQRRQISLSNSQVRAAEDILWAEARAVTDKMGYLNATRRVRKFQI